MSDVIEPSEVIEPWGTLTLEAMLARIQQQGNVCVEIKWRGGGRYSRPAKWFVEWGHVRSTGSDPDLLRALQLAEAASQVGEVRRDKHRAKLARRLARKQAEVQLEPVTD